MRVQLYSDLHNEFTPYDPPAVESDIVVLAGDIHVKERAIEWIQSRFPDKPILYVLGNHEYYGKALPRLTEKLKERAEGTNIHVLENDVFVLDGIAFFGCTFWTDFELFGDPRIAGYEAQQIMNDYRKIRVSPAYRKLRSIDTAVIHSKSRNWLKRAVAETVCDKRVVITHHAPSALSLPERRRSLLESAAYVSNEEDLVKELKIDYWFHGHIHHPCDYMIGETRVISNPKGYPDQEYRGFDDGLVIEIV